MRICFFLMFLAACGGPSEFAKQHELKVQAAREGCAAGARQHEQYMRLTPPSTVTGQVAQQWNQQMERKIASALEVCKPAMRLGKARIAKLDEVYNKLKAVQAQQYE